MKHISVIISFLFCISVSAQKVGLVLSGGGASGMAHIGVIKALEENNIPIDYITGTSAGAIVGMLYSLGYTPDEMIAIATSDEYKMMAKGEINSLHRYYVKQESPSDIWLNFKIRKDFSIVDLLPTNLIDPALIDYKLSELTAATNGQTKYDFDSLMIPFRCLASDIENKQSVVFDSGYLHHAVRASMTYPLYINPIRIDSIIYFDGGLYNNFPMDVMDTTFHPDVIIGSSVGLDFKGAEDDNLLSQIRAMVTNPTTYDFDTTKYKAKGIIMVPDAIKMGIFDFDRIEYAIQTGYDKTIEMLDSIKELVPQRIDSNDLINKRKSFRGGINREIVIDNIEVRGLNRSQTWYVKRLLKGRKQEEFTLKELEPYYFRLIYDDKIDKILPKLSYKANGKYDLELDIRKEPIFTVGLGGNISSKFSNIGVFELDYKYFGGVGITNSFNISFGRFYSSLMLSSKIDFPLRTSFYLEPFIGLSRWDYFRNTFTFFDDIRPAFIIHDEFNTGFDLGFPIGNTSKITLTGAYSDYNADYFQNENFSSVDTADNHRFYNFAWSFNYSLNSSDYFRFPSVGNILEINSSYISGKEKYQSGNLSPNQESSRFHDWWQIDASYQKYFKVSSSFSLGLDLMGTYTNQKEFLNYRFTTLMSYRYAPTIFLKNVFDDNYVAYSYSSVGAKAVYNYKQFQLRTEFYTMLPLIYHENMGNSLEPNRISISENTFDYDDLEFLGALYFIYKSPIGPISISLNYNDSFTEPWGVLLNVGGLIFNRQALKKW